MKKQSRTPKVGSVIPTVFMSLLFVVAADSLVGQVGSWSDERGGGSKTSTDEETLSGDGSVSQTEQQEQEQEATTTEVVDQIDVVERGDDMVGIAISAGEGSTGGAELARRPLLRPGDVVETVPGMIATQHSGGGKGNQYFIRGFNLDHGTDFSISVGGVPVNMPSHGHGQGYADLNFLIPEVVERARFRKGPFWAETGDFSTAGSLDIDLVRTMPEGLLSLSAGSYDYGRALWADSFGLPQGDLLVAVDAFHDDGPYARNEDFDGGRGVVKFTTGDSRRGLTWTALAYDASWLSTDQIPRRLVESGALGRFDLVDPGPRGETQRISLAVSGHRSHDASLDRWNAYLLSYDFDLVSNFTYFLEDPERGDQFRQLDDRIVGGISLDRHWIGSLLERPFETTVGFGVRYDEIDNALLRTQALQTIETVRRDRINQLTGGPFIESRWSPSNWLRISAGLRVDGFYADVDSDLQLNSGRDDDILVSPKLNLAFGPFNRTDFYLGYGEGFHSNDARGATIRVDPVSGEPASRVDPLVKTKGIDFGVRTSLVPGLKSTLTLFALELDSELVFVGDGGATEVGRPSRRVGVEFANYYRFSPTLLLDLDLALTDAEFRDNDPVGREVPGSVGRTVAAGLSWDSPGRWSASLRWRYFGDVPLIEDGSTTWSSTSTVNGQIGYRLPNGWVFTVQGFNLLGRDGSDIEYFYASRLPEEPSDGVEDVHFHPLPSRSFRIVLSWRR